MILSAKFILLIHYRLQIFGNASISFQDAIRMGQFKLLITGQNIVDESVKFYFKISEAQH